MKLKAVFFDLDGTLLPMDQDVFIKAYLGGLCGMLAPYGYEPKDIAAALWKSTDAMVNNNGEKTNEDMFWQCFCAILGDKVRDYEPILNEYYKTDYQNIKNVCGYTSRAKEIVEKLKAMGITVVLATNPLFPAIATESRMRWAGFEPSDFKLYTTYENSSTCKPNTEYYKTLLNEVGIKAEECLMVGNDVSDDMVARTIGMDVFLLTDNLINKSGEDISVYPNGSFDELESYIDKVTK